MIVLGISSFYHDSAAAIVKDGEILAAAQEERFTRIKHDASFPRNAILSCLKQTGLDFDKIDKVSYYEKPFIKFDRLIETYLAYAPEGFGSFKKSMPVWLTEKLFQRDLLNKELESLSPHLANPDKLLFSEHHFSHAASAFYPSNYSNAAVLTMDGVGEWTTTSLSIGAGSDLRIKKEILFPHSIGLLYSAFTYFCGFKVNSGEYKLMGLAPYGDPKHVKLITDNLVDIKNDGSFRLNMDYFEFCTGHTMTGKKFEDLFQVSRRSPEEALTQEHMDIAASIQVVTEQIILKLTRAISKETSEKNLCLAGGVALNCVANGKILRDGLFEKIYIQPASGDAGGALGAALAACYLEGGGQRYYSDNYDTMKGSYLGPENLQTDIENQLNSVSAKYSVVNEEDLIEKTVDMLVAQKAVGWRQARLEFGPRALGASSILADPRSDVMQKILNLKVKFRESFRPFAPSILQEKVSEWFELNSVSPYMLIVADVLDSKRIKIDNVDKNLFGIDKLNICRSQIPAVTHVDYSARVQTVSADTNPLYYKLLKKFESRTGCPILVNTSFNIRGEPIVSSPIDAFRCFMGTDLDFLAIGNCILYKSDQDSAASKTYKDDFELD